MSTEQEKMPSDQEQWDGLRENITQLTEKALATLDDTLLSAAQIDIEKLAEEKPYIETATIKKKQAELQSLREEIIQTEKEFMQFTNECQFIEDIQRKKIEEKIHQYYELVKKNINDQSLSIKLAEQQLLLDQLIQSQNELSQTISHLHEIIAELDNKINLLEARKLELEQELKQLKLEEKEIITEAKQITNDFIKELGQGELKDSKWVDEKIKQSLLEDCKKFNKGEINFYDFHENVKEKSGKLILPAHKEMTEAEKKSRNKDIDLANEYIKKWDIQINKFIVNQSTILKKSSEKQDISYQLKEANSAKEKLSAKVSDLEAQRIQANNLIKQIKSSGVLEIKPSTEKPKNLPHSSSTDVMRQLGTEKKPVQKNNLDIKSVREKGQHLNGELNNYKNNLKEQSHELAEKLENKNAEEEVKRPVA